jgi:hypothetical protein
VLGLGPPEERGHARGGRDRQGRQGEGGDAAARRAGGTRNKAGPAKTFPNQPRPAPSRSAQEKMIAAATIKGEMVVPE